ncbi:MAG TPA: hypothetical protein VJ755_08435 [Gemmatimonadales bacterium]|nr:hypothetical protein [Gemmatimonadales bacterium]
MTTPHSSAPDDRLPPSRIARWVLLAGVILFSVGLYFRFGVRVAPIGTVSPATTSTP